MKVDADEKVILERKDFAKIAEQTLRDFIDSPPPPRDVMDYALRLSSGSTGGTILVGMYKASALIYRIPITRSWYVGSDRVLCCFGPLTMRLFTVLDGQKFTEDALFLSIDPLDLTEEPAALIADFAPQKILGVPSYILHVAASMDEHSRARILSINVFGEFLTQTTCSLLSERFPNAVRRSLFAVSEIGAISTVSCDFQPPNFYHPRPGVSVALHEPDSEGVGELLVSTVLNQTIPVTRYQTGDSVRMNETPCQCGEKVTFEVLGRRGYDYIKLVGVTLRQEECQRVATALRAFDDYRIEASSVRDGERVQGKLSLCIFRKDGVGTAGLAREIGEKFSRALRLTPTRTLAELVADGLFVPLEVVFAESPFPAENKSIKLVERL